MNRYKLEFFVNQREDMFFGYSPTCYDLNFPVDKNEDWCVEKI